MRIQLNSIIAGQPAQKIRKLLNQIRDHSLGASPITIAELLNVDLPSTEKVIQDLYAQGYIEPISNSHEERWQNTRKGNALANATARRPITRHTAERLVEAFLNRVKEVNACNDYAYRVKQVAIFGSYLSDSPTLGDIDLFIILEPRYKDAHKQHSLLEKRTRSALSKGKSPLDATFWPHIEVLPILKGRSPSLSLHDSRNEYELLQGIPSKILFESDSETNQENYLTTSDNH